MDFKTQALPKPCVAGWKWCPRQVSKSLSWDWTVAQLSVRVTVGDEEWMIYWRARVWQAADSFVCYMHWWRQSTSTRYNSFCYPVKRIFPCRGWELQQCGQSITTGAGNAPVFFSKDGRWCMNVRPYPIEDRQFSYENAGSANISAMGAGAAGCLSFFSRCWLLQVGHGRQPLWITTRWSGAGSPAPRLGVEKPVTKQAV